MAAANYEKLGVFYLGRSYDLRSRQLQDDLLLYDSKDLVTHGVIVGMTGSGKTGLAIGLIEEAAIDSVPVIAIDPKGDLADLLLTFPDLKGEDFAPWVNPDEARKKGVSVDEYAEQQAVLWKKGLADWGQGGDRIQILREAADFCIYTPGSTAGIPISILKSFAAPGEDILNDSDLMRERVSTTATSLLGLLGIEADPIQSREHILLSTILDHAWREGRDLDLAALIQQVQTPPFTKVGVLDLESFYPAKERFGLVMALNNLVASPGFNAWLEGEPLDIGNILYTAKGKPRVSIFSIAHLSDPERMFFVSLLLNQILGWMRSQPGTTSLRALVYMDEIFGYFPPLSNPPAKLPLLTLLKQARAYGVGILLATQNPVDLDYKGLANTGTWFVGRLQTERDKARLLDGLEGVTFGSQGYGRQDLEQTISALGSRVFLMNNIHEDAPAIFQTRWAMSYLTGPLTRDQIKSLMGPRKSEGVASAGPRPQPAAFAPQAAGREATTSASPRSSAGQLPMVPSGITQFFVAARGKMPVSTRLLYQPRVLGIAKVRFADSKAKIDLVQDLTFATPVTDEAIPVDWDNAEPVGLSSSDLDKSAEEDVQYAELPALQASSQATWSKDFVTWLVQNQALSLMVSPSLKQVSKPGESERDFRIRLQRLSREARDEAVEQLRRKYAPKTAALQERIRRAQQVVDKQREQSSQQKTQTAISIGATVLSALTGRKIKSLSTMGRATTAMRGVARSVSEQQDVGRAQETVQALTKQLEDLESTVEAEVAELQAQIDPTTEVLETVEIRPKRTNISVQLVTLVWVPLWLDSVGSTKPAWI
jgi:hypothetical protein